jgi:hypothetical protein
LIFYKVSAWKKIPILAMWPHCHCKEEPEEVPNLEIGSPAPEVQRNMSTALKAGTLQNRHQNEPAVPNFRDIAMLEARQVSKDPEDHFGLSPGPMIEELR